MDTYDAHIDERNGNASIIVSFDTESKKQAEQECQVWIEKNMKNPSAWRLDNVQMEDE
jgi:hypothetical protein